MDQRYITLAIHTYDFAIGLRKVLEENGIDVRLENVDSEGGSMSSGVRVRIPSSSLPLALHIVEASMSASPAMASMKLEGVRNKVLIPVDFSPYSYVACAVGFAFAALIHAEAVLLNVYSSPYFDGNLADSEGFSMDLADTQMRKDLCDASRMEMGRLARRIRKEIIAGTLPAVKFSTVSLEGVPEDAILEYTRTKPPMLIVMATRGTTKKASEMIGSVTAEVIDSVRIPLFTVPENFAFSSLENMREIAFFCNVDQQDILAMDLFLRLFPASQLKIWLVPVSDRAGSKLRSRMDELEKYFSEHYPAHTFENKIFRKADFRGEFEKLVTDTPVDMLVVPDKKKNVFMRLFNPSIAHKIIFERDIPMMVLPV